MRAILVWLLLCAATGVLAQERQRISPGDQLRERADRGWFFYEDERNKQDKPPAAEPHIEHKPDEKQRCADKQTWTYDCGFVDPGDDFEFQAKQRDALLARMSMARNDPKAVEAFQYYTRWMMARAVEVANVWQYNMVQNPELDPAVDAPVSQFGIRLLTDVKRAERDEIFAMLRGENAFFIYFSRHDCVYCHSMTGVLKTVAEHSGLHVFNAALDDRCMPGMQAGCKTAPDTEAPAKALRVTTVPALFLYVPGNTWIRVANGVSDAETILARTVNFFAAYRTAMAKGIANSPDNVRPAVDFSGARATGAAPGVAGEAKPRLPTSDELEALLAGTR
jgi:conjugal transfer pilus assembly protein TraF